MPFGRWIRLARPVAFQAQPNTRPAPGRIRLKLFSANPQHVDAQAVTII
jgi:hypothetical protein